MKKNSKCLGLIIKSLLVGVAFWLMPSIAKADTPIPTSVVSSYDPVSHRLTLTVQWFWGSTANTKYVTAAVFADLNGDGISPTHLDNPATYTSGGNPFPAGLSARDEFLGQLAISTIDGTASSGIYPGGDRTDNGIAAQNGYGPTDPRVLFPYGTIGAGTVGSSGTYTLTYDNVFVSPSKICVVMYDVHTGNLDNLSGNHSPRSANPGVNGDNSVDDGNSHGTVSCGSLVNLRCAIDKTENACQGQTAINSSFAAWIASVTASGCNGVLTNNSTGAPSAAGGSKTVTFTYTQNGCSNQAAVTTCTATFTVLPCVSYYPDINVTYVNIPVPGNVQTNDVVPAGTTYGTSPTLISSPAGSSPSITMNSNGTYSFVSNVVGVYVYKVPVCVPGQAAPCPTTLLTITVLCATCNNNPPVANTDIATTKMNTPVVLNTLSNDRAGNPASSLNPASVVVTVAPLHGTTSINPATGDNTYTPANGYTGMDTLTYRVCDFNSPTPLCATAIQIINIRPSTNALNTTLAADDYAFTPINTAVSGNAKTNDTDPEGNTQTVTAQTTTASGKGTLVLAADGSFTFTPVTGFTGPVNFPYTTCDNGVPQACASATIYIVVHPELAPDFNTTFVNVHVLGNVHTNDKVSVLTTYGTPTFVSGPAGANPVIVMNSNGTYDFVSDVVGLYTYNVPVCVPGQTAPCPPTKLFITVLCATCNNNAPVANLDLASTKINTAVVIKTLANDHAGSAATALVPSTVTVTVAPKHGTTSINPATGDNTYTPAAGYTGTDTLTYQVCDNQAPAKCATAIQIITIRPVDNTTSAADDYNLIDINTVGTGNVKTNDTDPEGHAQTITAQTTTIVGKGTLVLSSTGAYTFTPILNFTGPVDFPYMTTDNGSPVATAWATLHILVKPVVITPDLTPRITANPNNIIGPSTAEITIQINEIKNATTNGGLITLYVDKLTFFSNFSFDNTKTMNAAGQSVQNSQFSIDAVSDNDFYIITTNAAFANSLRRVVFSVNVNPGQTEGTAPISVFLLNGSGGETIFTNNNDFTNIAFSFPPQ